MQLGDYYGVVAAKTAYVGGTATAIGSSLLAFAVEGQTSEVATGAAQVGWVGAVVGILGIVVRLAQIWANDRKDARDHDAEKLSLRRDKEDLAWFRAHYKPDTTAVITTSQAPSPEPPGPR